MGGAALVSRDACMVAVERDRWTMLRPIARDLQRFVASFLHVWRSLP
jgi:hypothetical protein